VAIGMRKICSDFSPSGSKNQTAKLVVLSFYPRNQFENLPSFRSNLPFIITLAAQQTGTDFAPLINQNVYRALVLQLLQSR
jgi:hypothetical protein